MSTPEQVEITRNTFIDVGNEEYLAATTTEEMYMGANAKGKSRWKPVPKSVKKSGVIPEGYAVDYKLDPLFVVAFLKKQGINYESEASPEMIQTMKDVTMSPDNMCIVPMDTWEGKQESVAAFIAKVLEDPSYEVTSVEDLYTAFMESDN
ncbi:hypothetical protein FA13DRAFT_1793701 [Coprinellus micaceus]|uniref:Uncharacterized protein n=1 Tax=Coprinellus micaceus TaxID=71717 RepID=A0A4Y7T5M0_COPMI|nr:hypothetical protein FA13DRAFT_1793701 [Coprinellus micaceus]